MKKSLRRFPKSLIISIFYIILWAYATIFNFIRLYKTSKSILIQIYNKRKVEWKLDGEWESGSNLNVFPNDETNKLNLKTLNSNKLWTL